MFLDHITVLGLPLYFVAFDFIIFCVAGWIYESAFVSVRTKKVVNRGFLIGPYLPLYGFGAVIVYILLRPFAKIPSLLYIMGMFVATFLEYMTSWLLEVCFHTRWWDYTKDPYNLNGRIALIPSMFWGILSLIMFDFLQPFATMLIEMVPKEVGIYIVSGILVLMAADTVVTVIRTINFRQQLETLFGFKKEIEELLEDVQLQSVKDFLLETRKEFSEKMSLAAFEQKNEQLYSKLKALKRDPKENSVKLAAFEERFRIFWEKRNRLNDKNPFVGSRRILDAFPTMKFYPKGQKAVSVKDLMIHFKKKTEPIREKWNEIRANEETKEDKK